MSDQLLCNSAVATAVPHDDAAARRRALHVFDRDVGRMGLENPMPSRFGAGYVYSGDLISATRPTAEFCRPMGPGPWQSQPLNHIRFRVGRNRRAWVKNVGEHRPGLLLR